MNFPFVWTSVQGTYPYAPGYKSKVEETTSCSALKNSSHILVIRSLSVAMRVTNTAFILLGSAVTAAALPTQGGAPRTCRPRHDTSNRHVTIILIDFIP